MRVPLRGDSQLARFLPSRLTDRSRSARPVRPQPATSIPAGGSKMHSLNIKKTKDLFVFLSFYSISLFSFNCLSLGREKGEPPVQGCTGGVWGARDGRYQTGAEMASRIKARGLKGRALAPLIGRLRISYI